MRKFTHLFFHIHELRYISSNSGIMRRLTEFDSYLQLDWIGVEKKIAEGNVDVGKRQNTSCEQGT